MNEPLYGLPCHEETLNQLAHPEDYGEETFVYEIWDDNGRVRYCGACYEDVTYAKECCPSCGRILTDVRRV